MATTKTITSAFYGTLKLELYAYSPTRGQVRLKEYTHYEPLGEWNYQETANKFRFWAPYDMSGAIFAGMAMFEKVRQQRIREQNECVLLEKMTSDIANEYKNIYDTAIKEL